MKWLAAFGLFVVLCFVLVMCGVLTHHEAGLVREDVRWSKSRFPLRVSSGAYAGDADAQAEAHEAVRSAVREVNWRLGFTVLKHVDGADSDIDVVVGVPQYPSDDPGAATDQLALTESGGFYKLTGDSGVKQWVKCQIMTSNTGTIFVLGLVLEHEFGHCLGLAHDDFDSSIMYPTQRDWGTDSAFPPRFTDSDRSLLRKLYGGAAPFPM